ncbi:unnamed protein product [Polarella glacialis]|uniref:Uncharacterized protein n=1 Tax=Polarella glacialis TaxID=89957 RepID=A0A813DJ92_POLGL|nr:unnamed protein product [Polarella glacialis]
MAAALPRQGSMVPMMMRPTGSLGVQAPPGQLRPGFPGVRVLQAPGAQAPGYAVPQPQMTAVPQSHQAPATDAVPPASANSPSSRKLDDGLLKTMGTRFGIGYPAKGQGSTSAVSDLNTSVGDFPRQPAQAGGVERRVAWLEEDVAVLHRRLRDECGEGQGGASGDPGLRALVARLDGELASERRSREQLEARIDALEESSKRENKEREVQLRNFAVDLESTMRGLIGRIDEGLSVGASAMRERTDQTEVRLRTLIKRVDEGLSAGAAALQDTICETGYANLTDRNARTRDASPQARG